jgi:hypothetical protein
MRRLFRMSKVKPRRGAGVLIRTLALTPLAGAIALLSWASESRAAEQSVIKFPGEHPSYFFEAEPHAVFGFGGGIGHDFIPGLGFRGTFIIVQNGFVPSINNSVGIGVGGDFYIANASVIGIPVVMQWNFFLTTHWSVFGEPGVGFAVGTHGGSAIHPIIAAGGRYHFTEKIALTMRIGYPFATVGVSIFF